MSVCIGKENERSEPFMNANLETKDCPRGKFVVLGEADESDCDNLHSKD